MINRAYQYSFIASWISREVRWKSTGAPAELMVPAADVPIDEFGLLNCGVLKMLKVSARN